MAFPKEDPKRLIGTVLGGRFEIKALLSMDGAGARYDADDNELGTPAAVRVFKDIRPDDASLQKLLTLLSEVSSFHLPGIEGLRAVGRTRSRDVYYATEPVDGSSLAERLELGPLLPEEAVSDLAGAGETLAQVHYRGVVHGALHPGALVLPSKGTRAPVHLLDFGLGPLSVSANTAAGVANAITPYQSPEQAKGDAFDQRADVYALGALLFEALTGRAPYAGQSAFEVLALQLRGEAPSLARVNARYEGSPLQQVIDTSMQVKPGDRYTSMQAMVMALRRAGRSEATRKVRAVAPKVAAGATSASQSRRAKPTVKPSMAAATKPQAKPSAKRSVPSRRPAPEVSKRPSVLATVGLVAAGALLVGGIMVLLGLGLPAAPDMESASRIVEPTAVEAPEEPAEEPVKRATTTRGSEREEPQDNAGKAVEAAIAARTTPPDPRAVKLIAEGNEALASGDESRALSRFQRAARVAPDLPAAARGLGMVYFRRGRSEAAVTELRRYLTLDPEAPDRGRIEAMITELERR